MSSVLAEIRNDLQDCNNIWIVTDSRNSYISKTFIVHPTYDYYASVHMRTAAYCSLFVCVCVCVCVCVSITALPDVRSASAQRECRFWYIPPVVKGTDKTSDQILLFTKQAREYRFKGLLCSRSTRIISG